MVVHSESLSFFYLSTARMKHLVAVLCMCVCMCVCVYMHIHACVSLSLDQVLNKCAYFYLFWILGVGGIYQACTPFLPPQKINVERKLS